MAVTRTITSEEKREILSLTHANPALFCRTFLKSWFPSRMPWVHKGILAILTRKSAWLLDECSEFELRKIESNFVYMDDDGNERRIFVFERDSEGNPKFNSVPRIVISRHVIIMMPRGFSKTTLMNAVNIYWIVFQETRFPVYCSHAGRHAQLQMNSVKNELESNELIKSIFGILAPDQRSGLRWSEEFSQTTTGIMLTARGRGAQIRGLNYSGQRPTRIIIDDFEDKESCKTEEQRAKSLDWVVSDVEPALPEMDPDAMLAILGTLLHRESAIERLRLTGEYTAVVFGAKDRQGDLLWPEMMDEVKLARRKQHYARLGRLHVFYMEYFNQLRNPEAMLFKPEHLIVGYRELKSLVGISIAIDPAISDREEADSCAIVAVGIRPEGGHHVIDAHIEVGMSPRKQIDVYFDFVNRYALPMMGKIPTRFGVESNAWQAALVHLLKEEMFKRNIFFNITPVTHSTKKTERIEGVLQPRAANGAISFQRNFREGFTQLLDYPAGRLDFPDVVAQALSLFDLEAPATAGNTSGANDELPPLAKVFKGNWRTY